MGMGLVEIKVDGQKWVKGVPFPAVVGPTEGCTSLTDCVKSQKPYIEELLHNSGAVLFRGFPLSTPSHFNDVVEAFGYDELPYVGGAAPRTNVIGRVYTANESPPDQKIPFHHEMSQVPEFPSKLFFFCQVEPASGGETPIVLSHIVYDMMKEKHPEFVERLEKHGLLYTRFLGEDDNPSSPIGRGWKSTFLTSDKTLAQHTASKLGMRLEWLEDGVKTVMGPIPGVKYDDTRHRMIWFNSMVAAYTGWDDERNDPLKAVTFGDSQPLPPHVVHDCLHIMHHQSVSIPWQKGDILFIDNLAVLHSRSSFQPPRTVLASLVK